MARTSWSDPSLIAPPEYASAAREQAALVLPNLTRDAREALERAQTEARRKDDDHVGTEHIVLAVLGDPDSPGARALSRVGVTRTVFAEQLHEEEGPSPIGRIPHTPRANRIIALASEVARSRGEAPVTSSHLLLGVVAESEEWESSGRPGVHHLRDAAKAAGTDLSAVRDAVEASIRKPQS